MSHALLLAKKAGSLGEVPVGAIIVKAGEIIGRGHNSPISSHDPTAHAEIIAIRDAGTTLGNYRLTGSTLYVTLEPCSMCAGAIVHARVSRLVFGAFEPKAGAVISTNALLQHPSMNYVVDVTSGINGEECSQVISKFFARRRAEKKIKKG